MCGICGIAHQSGEREVSEEDARVLADSLSHRGPDGTGVYRVPGVCFVHTRLSIIDVAGGQQPLCNEDGTVWVTFNGEIYNHADLRLHLESLGHRFSTRTDTEVLVHLYEEYGDLFVRRLNGMFAFAIHDQRRSRVVIGRDHFGIKPLFYALRDNTLYFGSEVKAVTKAGQIEHGTSTQGLQEYLLFRSIGGERSFYRSVNRLPPGCIGAWEAGELRVTEFWRPPAPTPASRMSMDESIAELEVHLEASVKSQLMSEVPLGTFCSGGVDSGLTSLYASRSMDETLQTFSVGFDDILWDETRLARDTARRIGSHHRVLQANSLAFLEALPRLLWHHDEPIGHPNSVLIGLLSSFARQTVTVVLTGEGSDELFGGYPRHHIVGLVSKLGGLPSWLSAWARDLLGRFGGRKGALLSVGMSSTIDRAIALNSSVVTSEVVEQLTGTPVTEVIAQRLAAVESLRVAHDPLATLTRYDQRFYLPALLDRMDRMTMAAGLEGRVPFLDVPLAEWASRVPTAQKMGSFGNKVLVKRLASRYLSPEITSGPKSGFGVPLSAWYRSAEWRWLVDELLDPNHPAGGVVDRSVVHQIVNEHLSGKHDHAEILWLLTNIFLWHRPATFAASRIA